MDAYKRAVYPAFGLREGALQLAYNATGDVQCHDIRKEYFECADPTGYGLGNE
jgi:hypothetical protein